MHALFTEAGAAVKTVCPDRELGLSTSYCVADLVVVEKSSSRTRVNIPRQIRWVPGDNNCISEINDVMKQSESGLQEGDSANPDPKFNLSL